ncbi:MAG: type II/IV secretion system protein [Candidatus Moranbacteria bacterium]|nr:type II/IV secretion system protein [Candidatus Moranbacteria bacterium]
MKIPFDDNKKTSSPKSGTLLMADDNKILAEEAKKLGIPYLKKSVPVFIDVLNIIPEDIARANQMVVFEKKDAEVKVGIVDPQNINALNVLRFISEKTQLKFEVYLISKNVFQDIIVQYSGSTEKAIEEAAESLKEDEDGNDRNVFSMENEVRSNNNVQSAPVTKLLSVIIRHAIDGKASDIHIEPIDKEYRVRFRVDGVLYASLEVPNEVGKAVVSRIKILANLKIDEKRKPQDGRFNVVENGHQVDFRVSTLPIMDGEKVVLRILDKENKLASLENMGISGKSGDILIKNIKEPFGIILITGPTGSGKSTTLYSCLETLNKEERNIITLEDPVEYSIAGINQSQINPDIGYTFASGLRSILRQDPNIIMVGEIRDSETAELTIHAALTGHLVLSTLHTNSSIGAIPRLIDMGVEAFLLSSSLRVVAAQRLVRRICEKCKQEVKISDKIRKYILDEIEGISPEDIARYEVNINEDFSLFEGKGCEDCGMSGYKGRIAIFEALEIDPNIKEIISERDASEKDIRDYAKKQGMITIKQDGMLKAIAGKTTFSEIERVTEGSRSIGGDVDDA